MVFVLTREMTPALTGLVKKIDTFVKEDKKSAAFITTLEKKSDETKAKLKKLAKDEKVEIPLTIADDSGIGKKLEINDKVKNTILIWKGHKVTANFALNEIREKDVEEIVKAAKEASSSS